MAEKKKRLRFIDVSKVALKYSDGLSRTSIVFLCLVSLLCATCNVMVPLLQKWLLETLDHTTNEFIWIMAAVAAGGCLFLMLENFINISVMMRFRKELEDAMVDSLAFKEQPLIQKRGVGVFAGTVVGDSEQLSRVLAANWFSLGFNLIGTVISIIISAQWELYFLFTVLIAYFFILLIVFFTNKASVSYFRKEKSSTYIISADFREMTDTHRSLFTFGSYRKYQDSLMDKRSERFHYSAQAERMTALGTALIRLVQMMALVALFFFAAKDLRGMSEAQRAEKYPIIVALVSYLESIFSPIGTLNTTYNLSLKFRAFYEPFTDYVAREALGELPTGLDIKFHNLTEIREGSLILAGINLEVDDVYGVYGLEGEAKQHFLSFLRGESYPEDGHITIGGARIYEIEKYLRLGLITFTSAPADLFGRGLEFNVTMGKDLLEDESYDAAWEGYQDILRSFFELLDANELFTRRYIGFTADLLGDFYAFDKRHLRDKTLQKEIISRFQEVRDREGFIQSVGHCVFTRKYAKLSRYEMLVGALGLESLREAEFGISGKKLTQAERAAVLLARFLLPESKAPFVLLDPLEYLSPSSLSVAVALLKDAIKGRKGFIFSQDVDEVASLAHEILFFEHGHLRAKGTHAHLKKSSRGYAKAISPVQAKKVLSSLEPAKEETKPAKPAKASKPAKAEPTEETKKPAKGKASSSTKTPSKAKTGSKSKPTKK